MANIVVRRGNGGRIAAAQQQPEAEWNPFRMMRDLARWDPFRALAPLGFDDTAGAFVPPFEVRESKDAYVFKADMPGVKEEDLEITAVGNRLTVSGKRESELQAQDESDTFYLYERSYGTFSRTFTLPEGVDTESIRAEMKNGVLTLVVPKRPESMPKKIQIKSGGEGAMQTQGQTGSGKPPKA